RAQDANGHPRGVDHPSHGSTCICRKTFVELDEGKLDSAMLSPRETKLHFDDQLKTVAHQRARSVDQSEAVKRRGIAVFDAIEELGSTPAGFFEDQNVLGREKVDAMSRQTDRPGDDTRSAGDRYANKRVTFWQTLCVLSKDRVSGDIGYDQRRTGSNDIDHR